MRLAVGVIAAAFAALGCTHDFDAFLETQDGALGDSGLGSDTPSTTDSRPSDTAGIDSAAIDSTAIDSTAVDSTAIDSAVIDSGAFDSRAIDTGVIDSGSDSGPSCSDPGGVRFGGHCYFPAPGGSIAYDAARTACTTAGGAHLATITSAAEQATVAGLRTGTDRWIGLRRPVGSPVVEGSYVWITAESVSYKNWASGEPNGDGECVRLRSTDLWGDNPCTSDHNAICERE